MTGSATCRIGFVGLGMMGHPLAGRLSRVDQPLAVFDLSAEARERFAAEFPCRLCSSAPEVGRGAELVITMLPNSDDVFLALLGSETAPGIVSTLRPGSLVLDMSSSDPDRTRELAAVLERRGIGLADAPVSGAVKRAREGTLTIMFGGSKDALARCRPVLERVGSVIVHTGAVGTGHAMKALNNFVSAAGLVATVEALHAGRAFGLEEQTMTWVLNASTGRNNTTENKVVQFMLSGAFNSGFSLRLMAKDVATAVRLAEQLEMPMVLGEACARIWSRAADEAEALTDHTEMYRLLGVREGR